MKIATTGSEGTIGRELVKRGCIPINIDITNSELIRNEIEYINPDVVIHCAALTDVKYCEEHFKESFEVNVRGTSNVVEAMPKNSLLIYLSTDHVFSGDNWVNHGYGEKHKPSPVNRFVNGLLYLANTYTKYPKLDIINIAGENVFSYYLFWSSLKKYLGLPGEIKPRGEELKDEVPIPFRGGLEVVQAKKLGIPIYSITDGFELLKQGG